MKVVIKGTMTLAELSKALHEVVVQFMNTAGVEEQEIQLVDPIVQTAFSVDGNDEAVFLTTEFGEMLQVEVEVADGEIVEKVDNELTPTEDKRLWSYAKIMDNPTEVSTVEIESDYDETDLEYIKCIELRGGQVEQRIFDIVGTDQQLFQYVNTEQGILIAEEVVGNKEEQE